MTCSLCRFKRLILRKQHCKETGTVTPQQKNMKESKENEKWQWICLRCEDGQRGCVLNLQPHPSDFGTRFHKHYHKTSWRQRAGKKRLDWRTPTVPIVCADLAYYKIYYVACSAQTKAEFFGYHTDSEQFSRLLFDHCTILCPVMHIFQSHVNQSRFKLIFFFSFHNFFFFFLAISLLN